MLHIIPHSTEHVEVVCEYVDQPENAPIGNFGVGTQDSSWCASIFDEPHPTVKFNKGSQQVTIRVLDNCLLVNNVEIRLPGSGDDHRSVLPPIELGGDPFAGDIL